MMMAQPEMVYGKPDYGKPTTVIVTTHGKHHKKHKKFKKYKHKKFKMKKWF